MPASVDHSQSIKKLSIVEKLMPLYNIYMWGVSGRVADALFYFIVFKYAASEATGTFVWTMAIAAFFSVAMDFGLNQILGKEFGQDRIEISGAIALTLATRLPLILLAAISVFIWYHLWAPSTARVVGVSMALIAQTLIVFELTLQVWVKARGHFGIAGVLATLDPVARLCVAFSLLMFGLPLVSAYLFGGFIICHAAIITLHIWTVARLNRDKAVSMEWKVAPNRKMLFAAGGVALISGLSMLQNRADWLILDKFVGPQILAQYSLSNKIYELIMTIGGLGYAALFAQLSKSINVSNLKDSHVFNQLKIVKITTIILSLLSFLFCSLILGLFPNFDQNATVKISEIFSLMAIFSIIIAEMYYIALAAGAYRFLLFTSIATTCIQLLVNLYLIEKIGVWGAVIGMGALTVSNMLIYLTYLKSFNGDLHRRTLKDLLIISAVVCICVVTKWNY